MLNPFDLKKLDEQEEAKAEAIVEHIDGQIKAAFDNDPSKTAFTIDRSELSKSVKGMTIKVREYVLNQYRSEKWRVELDDAAGTVTLTMPKRRGRGKSKKNQQPEPVEPAPAVA